MYFDRFTSFLEERRKGKKQGKIQFTRFKVSPGSPFVGASVILRILNRISGIHGVAMKSRLDSSRKTKVGGGVSRKLESVRARGKMGQGFESARVLRGSRGEYVYTLARVCPSVHAAARISSSSGQRGKEDGCHGDAKKNVNALTRSTALRCCSTVERQRFFKTLLRRRKKL